MEVGQTYIDVTVVADDMPQGDEKAVASEYAVSFGANAVTAAFCCAKLGIKPDLIATLADDWLGAPVTFFTVPISIPISPDQNPASRQ